MSQAPAHGVTFALSVLVYKMETKIAPRLFCVIP